MKPFRYVFTLAVILLTGWSVQAQDEHSAEEQLEFFRKLRDKGYLDLATEYLEGMRAEAPPAMQHTLQFELAKTRLLLARGLDPEERIGVVEQARSELEEFLKKFGNTSEADIVRQDLKRLTGEQAQAMLSLALRMRGVEAQQEKAKLAEKFFIQAGTELEASMKDLGADAKLQASFDLAVNKMEQARCYVNMGQDDIRSKRSEIVAQARALFEDLANKDNGKIGLSSRAWLIKCCSEDEGSDPLVSNKYYEQSKNLLIKDAEGARRLARYFQMVRIPKIQTSTLTPAERYAKVEFEAKAWLKSYPTYYKTPLGYGVRYELANALFNQALYAKIEATKNALYSQAQDILYKLNESDNDLIGKVAELRSKIARVHLGKTDVSISSLNTFDLCFIRAGIEYDRVLNLGKQIEEAKDDLARKKLEKKLKEHFRGVVQCLSRALALSDKRTPRYAVENVRYDLLVAYAKLESPFRTRTPYRTAIYGEAIARSIPPSKHGPVAAELAIDAYARILGVDSSAGNRERLRSLANFAISPERKKLWDRENVIGLAHYQLAMLDQSEATLLFAEAERLKDSKEKLLEARAKYRDCIDHLRKLPKDRPSDVNRYFFAQSKAVFLALEARDKVAFPEEKKFYRDEARKLIKEMPPLSDAVDPVAIGMYFHARMEESKFLYEDAAGLVAKKEAAQATQKYKELADFLEGIAKELQNPALKIEEARRDQLEYYVGTMQKYAAFGLADFAYKTGEYDKVLEPGLTGRIVDLIKKAAEKDPVVRLKDFQITGQIIGLALRANVQKGNIEEAKKLMKILENLKDVKDNALVDTSSVLRSLVGELDVQIHELHRLGDQAKLKRTLSNFSDFLDALVKQADKKLDRKDLFFLARCYDTLEQHDKAAELYARYPAPAVLDKVKKDKEKFSEEDERELQSYWYSQVMLAKQLRLQKKLTEAKQTLDAVIAHQNARQLLQVEREQIYLLEENGLFGTAITRWSQLMNNPMFKGPELANDMEKKKIYFDAYYHLSYAWYKYSQLAKVKAAGKDAQFLVKAADYIVRLETSPSPEGWQMVGHRFRDLLRNEPLLQEAYTKQKGGG